MKEMTRKNIKLLFYDDDMYQVDEKNGRVICRVRYSIRVPNALWSAISAMDMVESLFATAKGVAVCKDGDVFDVEKGKKIARAIAESNAYANASRKMVHRIRTMFNYATEFSCMIRDFKAKSMKVVAHNSRYIQKVAE